MLVDEFAITTAQCWILTPDFYSIPVNPYMVGQKPNSSTFQKASPINEYI